MAVMAVDIRQGVRSGCTGFLLSDLCEQTSIGVGGARTVGLVCLAFVRRLIDGRRGPTQRSGRGRSNVVNERCTGGWASRNGNGRRSPGVVQVLWRLLPKQLQYDDGQSKTGRKQW